MSQPKEQEPQGCLVSIFTFLVRTLMRLLGLGGQAMRRTLIPVDAKYQEYVDSWVSERLAGWLHETRSDIDIATATKVLTGQADRYPELAALIRETLIDAKVTFSQRDSKQYLEIEAYMAPRQQNGKQPQIMRWRAEREIAWQDIPNDVREHLIRSREPVTLGYSIPQ